MLLRKPRIINDVGRLSLYYSRGLTSTVDERPTSPHLTIYQKQLTSAMSIGHRITGAALSGGLYAFGTWYLLGAPQDGVSLVDQMENVVRELPIVVEKGGKIILSAPLLYNVFNGIRHLLWDAGYALSLRAVYVTGVGVLLLTATGSLALSLY